MGVWPVSRVMIVPAAGFGRRVGSPEAKELLLREGLNEPLIEQPLRLASENAARVVVVTREEKASLLRYLGRRARVVLVRPTREWPESLLLSAGEWGEFNLVCLPDTEFAPLDVVGEMFRVLERGADVVFATFVPADGEFRTWGVVDTSELRHCEKPRDVSAGAAVRAWGLFAFRRACGERLLQQMLESTFDHEWRDLSGLGRVEFLELDAFRDLTR